MLAVAGLWLLFGGTHIGLATRPVRSRLVARFGEAGFTAIFYLVAALSFAWLISYYAAHRFDGAAGLDLAALPAARWRPMPRRRCRGVPRPSTRSNSWTARIPRRRFWSWRGMPPSANSPCEP
jgi:hypothetical protein